MKAEMIRMVVSRSRRLSITRVAMMPGIAQAKLDSSGMKARPRRPPEQRTRIDPAQSLSGREISGE